MRNYQTKDERSLSFCCLQASRYWAELCVAVGRPELGTDPRFADHAGLVENSLEAQSLMEEAFAQHTVAEWRELLADFTGQWCVVQDTLECAVDPQSVANGYMQDCETASGTPFQMVASPVQFGGETVAGAPRPRIQRARRCHPRRSRHRLGYDRGPQGPLRRRLGHIQFTACCGALQGGKAMGLFDAFRYDGKRVLVVGGATGMGAAAAELVQDAGAEVVVMDFAEVKLPGAKAIHVNLAEEASIDKAVDECGGPIHALFSCAGVADGTPGIEKINFVGHRHLINRMLDGAMLPRGSAIGFISSAAGLGWESHLGEIKQYLDTPDFDSGSAWAIEHGYADYFHSKQAVCAYVAREAFPLLKQGIRINAICPGPTDTPLAQANAEMWLGFGADFREETGIEASTPLEQAYPLVFLCSEAAAAISGITLISDVGYVSSGITGAFPPATPAAGFLLDRSWD